ncbi:lignostilbene-alpha,beta-dioxygenase [Nitzschia inconspicua]|uniref:Lignostilbene-alpha,beta-dioxygenase n=1 Tax=Nitzschia inconspicua TaxID=303405 RepID=A0A9K3L7K4_9STRA|nr:lignostilbene-alpha,beta-dioxygenase [Nitzschia inconspicua]
MKQFLSIQLVAVAFFHGLLVHGFAVLPMVKSTDRSIVSETKMVLTDTNFVDETLDVVALKSNGTMTGLEIADHCYWEVGPTFMARPVPTPLPPKIFLAMETGTHPVESQEELGRGVFVTADWRRAWSNYESPPDNPGLIDPATGYAEYNIEEIEGEVPPDLVGTLYRNGPGLFGRGGERTQHVLDADALVYSITFPPVEGDINNQRTIRFRSRFVETQAFKEEREVDKFLYRSTFGTGPAAFFDQTPKNGLNGEPLQRSLLSRMVGMGGKINIKNSANTHVIFFGGKLLALFEAGLPHLLDPLTLETIGEDTLGGTLKQGLPVKFGAGTLLQDFVPSFLGGDAHTAHPNVCPKTGNLVGWHWAQQIPAENGMIVTLTEWSPKGFTPVESKTYTLPGCELAPHDMAITENYVLLKVNALKMNHAPFLLGVKGPAASLEMDGRSPVTAWVFPRPTAGTQFEPFPVQVPPCFSIHFSHAYEDEVTGNIVSFFSGWPESDATDFLGAWGGFSPDFRQIPPTFLWRLEIDPKQKTCVSLNVAPGSANTCVEHILVHPNFNIRKAEYVYGTGSNLIGDSSPPCGYVKCKVESGKPFHSQSVSPGEFNSEVDAYWFGSRYFVTEPLIVPKQCGDPGSEEDAYLLAWREKGQGRSSNVARLLGSLCILTNPKCGIELAFDRGYGKLPAVLAAAERNLDVIAIAGTLGSRHPFNTVEEWNAAMQRRAHNPEEIRDWQLQCRRCFLGQKKSPSKSPGPFKDAQFQDEEEQPDEDELVEEDQEDEQEGDKTDEEDIEAEEIEEQYYDDVYFPKDIDSLEDSSGEEEDSE